MLDAALEEEKVIGVDVCGECASSLDFLRNRKAASQNDRVNSEILKLVLEAA